MGLAPETLVRSRLDKGVTRQSERQAQISALFVEAGCVPEEQKVDRRASNVICALPGETSETIVVGGHFDFVERGAGIVDDWSGVALLPSLYQGLKTKPRRHTYVFIAFAAEETGLNGSGKYVKGLSREQRKQVYAFINLECLGVAPPYVWLSRANPALAAKLAQVAQAIGVPLKGVNVDQIGDDDSHPFRDAGIPVLTLHSTNQLNLGLLHSAADNLKAIRMDDYMAAYKLAAYFLSWLDEGTAGT